MGDNRNSPWPGRDPELKRLHTVEKLSASKIAARMNLTRNQVIGRCSRIGLKHSTAVLSANAKWEARTGITPKFRPVRSPPRPGPQNRPGAVFGAVSIDNPEETERKRQACQAEGERVRAGMAEPANDTAVPLMDRGRFQCSWPVGEPVRPAEQMCCGMPVPEGANASVETYCAHHARKAVSRTLVGGKPDAKVYERSMRRFA